MRKAQPVFAFALLVTLACLCSQTPVTPETPEQSKVGTINLVNSQVESGPLDNLQFLEGLQDFHNGDGVRVTGGGKGELALDDGTQLLLFNETQVDRVNVSISPNETRLRLVDQGLDGYVPPGETFIAEMPNGTVFTILGTNFIILYDTDTQVATAGNFDGTVRYTPLGGTEQGLPAGRMARITAEGDVTLLPLPFTAQEFEAAVDSEGTPSAALAILIQRYDIQPEQQPTEPPVAATEPPVSNAGSPTITVVPPAVAGWSTWEELGGEFKDSPAVASWAPNRLDIFVRGMDDTLWHKALEGDWGDWQSLGGQITSSPAAVSSRTNRIDIFALGLDHQVWQYVWDGGWSGWFPQGDGDVEAGSSLQEPPAVASPGPDRLDLFVVQDLLLLYKHWDGSKWSAWEQAGSPVSSPPSVIYLNSERYIMATRGPNHQVYVRGLTQSGWMDVGQTIQGTPAVTAWGEERLDIFARGSDDRLLHTYTTESGWAKWEDLGGPIYSSPAAVSWGPGRIDVFARDKAGQLIHIWYQE
jgi:hypothetical protein